MNLEAVETHLAFLVLANKISQGQATAIMSYLISNNIPPGPSTNPMMLVVNKLAEAFMMSGVPVELIR